MIPEVGLNSLGTLSLGVGTPKYMLDSFKIFYQKYIFTIQSSQIIFYKISYL